MFPACHTIEKWANATQVNRSRTGVESVTFGSAAAFPSAFQAFAALSSSLLVCVGRSDRTVP